MEALAGGDYGPSGHLEQELDWPRAREGLLFS